MVFQGRSIQAKVELDLQPFQNQLSDMQRLLSELGKGVNVDFGSSKLKYQMDDLKRILYDVGMEAEKITTAFNKIEGFNQLLDNLSVVKSRLEYIQADIDKINQSVIKEEGTLNKVAVEEKRISQFVGETSRAESRVYDTIVKRLEAQGRLASTVQEQLNLLSERNSQDERDIAFLDEQLALQKQINSLVAQGGAENIKQAEALMKQIDADTEVATILKEEIALEKEKLTILEEQDAMIKKQVADREKEVAMAGASVGAGAGKGKNQLDKMGYLPSRISSMAVTMLGYQEIMDVWNKTTANINAKTQFGSYAKLLQEDNRYLKQTKQSTADVTKGIGDLNKAINDTYNGGRSLQQIYSKVDMQQVGANALDTAFKYGVQAKNLDELTEVMAIYSSEFVRQGRSQEDSILAVNDALDGEFRRLKEVNIGKEELEAHGYEDGNTLSLIRAMREIAEERGYDVTAQKITTLSEAINQTELELAFLLSDLFELVEPSLIYALGKLVQGFRWLGDGVKQLKNYFKGLPQGTKDFLKAFGGNAMLGLVGLWVGSKIFGVIKNIGLFGNAWTKLMEKLGRTKGIDEATESMGKMSQTTGGTVGQGGSVKDGIKNWGKNLAKNIGKMVEVFIEVAIAIAMAWALLKEAMIIIADLGKEWESHKAEIESGMTFIKSYGIWILAIAGAMAVALQYVGQLPDIDWKSQVKGFGKLALGLGEAMLLIAEAITLLIVPMGAVALLGYLAGMLDQTSFNNGINVIKMYANALNYIASDDSIGWFIIGLVAVSGILGVTGDTVAIPLAVGIATSLTLIAEAITLLIVPLGAVALLGSMAGQLNQEAISTGAKTIELVSNVLKALEPAVRKILEIDFEVFGIGLVEKGNQIVNGKGGLTSLTQDIIPNLVTFIKDFSNLEIPTDIDITTKVQAVTQMANQITPLFTAMQNLNNAMGTGGVVGKATTWLGGVMDSHMGTGLKPQLDKLYNDVKDVMDFANKLGKLSTGENGTNASAVTQVGNAISQLKTKLDSLVTTISTYADKVKLASKSLGTGLKTGFSEGSNGFSSTVVGVLAKGIGEVQSRYNTWHSGGKASAQKLTDGFKTFGNTLKSTIDTEMGYALSKLDEYKDDFYNKGKDLGSELTRGYQDGADIHSPGLIARTTARELRYTMDALNVGEQMMYKGGVALGRALTDGYGNSGNLRTDVGILANKGISDEQLKANAKNVQANNKDNGKVGQSLTSTINIDMSNSTVIGVQDLDAKIRQAVEKAIVTLHSSDGAIGY